MTNTTQQIVELMRERIESGAWRSNSRIPSQNELAYELQVSPSVVRHATAELRKRGYVRTLPYKGSYARPAEDWQRDPG